MILNDIEIAELCTNTETPMISPFEVNKIKTLNGKPAPSYGLGPTGYDIRLGRDFKEPTYTTFGGDTFDTMNLDDMHYIGTHADSIVLEPGHMILGHSVETFIMPDDVMAIAANKSTYARCGAFLNITPLEVGWRGILTIEISNIGHKPVKFYAGAGIIQLLFFRCNKPSGGYSGKYQDQSKLTVAKN